MASSILLLWALSFPGFGFVPMWIAFWCLLLLGLVWVLRLVGWVTDPHRLRERRWFLAPALLAFVVVLGVADVPLRIRFEFARSEFDDAIRDLEPRGSSDEWEPIDVPRSIGGYTITRAYQVGENVIFYESNGWMFHDAGFAHLPDGPDVGLESGSFESPVFRRLSGDWYAWSASW